jgi:hypothetical protein
MDSERRPILVDAASEIRYSYTGWGIALFPARIVTEGVDALAIDRFSFSAAAGGLSANLTRPVKAVETKGQSVLQATGGYGSDSVEDFAIEEIVKIESASVQVSGIESSLGSWETLATSTVTGLDILGIVQADVIVARVSTKYPRDGKPTVSLLGSHFEGLVIAGKPVEVTIDDNWCREHSRDKILEFWKASRSQYLRDFHQFDKDEVLKPKFTRYAPYPLSEEMPKPGQAIASSIVQRASVSAQGCSQCGHVIRIPDFGTIILGEVLVDGLHTSLTMFQADLGSPVEGALCVSSGKSGGTPVPPPPPDL